MIKRHKKANPARHLFAVAPLPSTVSESSAPEAGPKPRHDGWTPDKQKRFCQALADGSAIEEAANIVGLTRRAAYALRTRDPEFAMHWDGARHIARQALVDTAAVTAFEGRIVRTLEKGLVVRERKRNSAALVIRSLKRMRSKAILGKPAIVAASRDFSHCMDLLEKGIAWPDPEAMDADIVALQPNPTGWPPATQRAFCEALAFCGNVEQACAAIGKPRSTAYATRHSAGGQAFAIAWDAALLFASEELLDLAMDMLHKGSTEKIYEYGALVKDSRTICAEAQCKGAQMLEDLMVPVVWTNDQTIFKDCDGFGAKLDKLESGALQHELEARRVGA